MVKEIRDPKGNFRHWILEVAPPIRNWMTVEEKVLIVGSKILMMWPDVTSAKLMDTYANIARRRRYVAIAAGNMK